MAPRPLILASSSRWRRDLLAAAGLPCEAEDPGVDEAAIQADDPDALALARARAKALAVARRRPGALVIGADQVAHLDGECFGKPTGPEDWLARLKQLRGRTHLLSTGVVLAQDEELEAFVVRSAVRFRADLEDAELRAYVALGEAAGCAGGYMVEGQGAWLVDAVDGDWSNVVGLPIFALIGRLRARGARLRGPLERA